MLVSEVKRNTSMKKDLIGSEDPDYIIKNYIEKPLQKACKQFKNKNIETCMSSANKSNIIIGNKNKIQKTDILNGMKHHKIQTFLQAGRGYAWIMVNYNNLSQENKKVVFSLKNEIGDDNIWFVKPTGSKFFKKMQNIFNLNDVILSSGDEFDKQFEENEIVLMYNTNKYPGRSVFIRMPIDETTEVEDVENYFDKIVSKFEKQ